MYFGVPSADVAVIDRIEKSGLFVEPYESPYREDDS